MAKRKAYEQDLDCEFGGVSYGHETARLGVKLDRQKLDLADADAMFAGKRVECEVSLLNRMDRGQKRLKGMEDNEPPTITTVADIKRFGVSPTVISASLTFNKSSIDVGALPEFANETGTLKLTVMGDIPEDEGCSDDDGDDDDTADPESKGHGEIVVAQKRVRGGRHVTKRVPASASVVEGDAGAKQKLSALKAFGMTPKKLDAVAASVGPTVGHLEKAMRENEYWHKDIKGLGREWIDRLTDSLLQFRLANPVPSEEDSRPTLLEAAGAES